uniref:Uncharacterized protein n=1 Tax=Oryza sativa subsp. japonica TaxID=39947 RepID=Q5VPU3_ORYSJ|nr:hypothetical protein [Oryza sativa Japonica Group]
MLRGLRASRDAVAGDGTTWRCVLRVPSPPPPHRPLQHQPLPLPLPLVFSFVCPLPPSSKHPGDLALQLLLNLACLFGNCAPLAARIAAVLCPPSKVAFDVLPLSLLVFTLFLQMSRTARISVSPSFEASFP